MLMFRQLKLTCRGMLGSSPFFFKKNLLQRSLIMAQEQKSTRRKEQKAPKKNSCPRAARPLSKGKFCGCLISAALLYNVK